MTGHLGWFWLLVVLGLCHAQTIPVGHIPGGSPNLSTGKLCDLTDVSTLVGEITVNQHATLFEGFGSSAASEGYFIAGLTSTGTRRALLRFDVADAGFPADAKVLCAEIRLSLNLDLSSSDAAPPEVTLHQVTRDWSNNADSSFEDLNGSPAVPRDVTWEYTSYPIGRWDNAGGDFGGEALSRQQKTVTDEHEYEWFGNTKRMHALVDQWISDSSSNHGVLIKSDELPTDPIAYNVYNGGEGAIGLAPKLIVVYTTPSLGYPHKVAQNPNVPTKFPTFAPTKGIVIPTNSPTVLDDLLIGFPTDSPSMSPVSFSNNGPPTSNSDSSDGASDSSEDGGNPFGFKRDSNSNSFYTAVAISVTGIMFAALMASVFGLIPHTTEPEEQGDIHVDESGTPTEMV